MEGLWRGCAVPLLSSPTVCTGPPHPGITSPADVHPRAVMWVLATTPCHTVPVKLCDIAIYPLFRNTMMIYEPLQCAGEGVDGGGVQRGAITARWMARWQPGCWPSAKLVQGASV